MMNQKSKDSGNMAKMKQTSKDETDKQTNKPKTNKRNLIIEALQT